MLTRSSDRAGGWLLIEAMIALTVLTVGILGFMFAFQSNFKASRELGVRDQVQVALDSAADVIHSTAFSSIYSTYQGVTLQAPGLVDSSGAPAVVTVHFDVNETTLPAEYGPVQDIDGDGAKTSTNASTSYVILPTRLNLTYQMSYGMETRTQYLLLRP